MVKAFKLADISYPMIQEHKFGSFIIDGKTFLGDIKIMNARVRYWSTRDKHVVFMKDIKDIIEYNPEVLIVGTGNSGYLEIDNNVRNFLVQNKIKLFMDKNTPAIDKYNQLVSENKKVAAIFHATC